MHHALLSALKILLIALQPLVICNALSMAIHWDLKAIKHCGEEIYKINIQEFDEETSMKLFIIHSCSQENLPNKLIEVDKNIIRLYNGLLLSLKVIKVFLKKNKKLRCWEQALQKLKTRRGLDGDENNNNYMIWKIQRVSFDNLKVEEKKIFLDFFFTFFFFFFFFKMICIYKACLKKEHCKCGSIVKKHI